MIAILYCRGEPVEVIRTATAQQAINDAWVMLGGLNDQEIVDWRLRVKVRQKPTGGMQESKLVYFKRGRK